MRKEEFGEKRQRDQTEEFARTTGGISMHWIGQYFAVLSSDKVEASRRDLEGSASQNWIRLDWALPLSYR